MKIYSMMGLLVNDENPYAMLVATDPEFWSKQSTYDDLNNGTALNLQRLASDEAKHMGDFIMIGTSGLASNDQVIAQFKIFAPKNVINRINVEGDCRGYGVIRPRNHQPMDVEIAHIFMMFRQFKSLLVTQMVKDAWENLGLTGAVFERVAEMNKHQFIRIAA